MSFPPQGTFYKVLYPLSGHKCTNTDMLMMMFSTCESRQSLCISSEHLNAVNVCVIVDRQETLRDRNRSTLYYEM